MAEWRLGPISYNQMWTDANACLNSPPSLYQTCCCSLAGTSACTNCFNRPGAGGNVGTARLPDLPFTVKEILTEIKSTKEKSVRGLYEGFVVDGDNVESFLVVANDDAGAKVRIAVKAKLSEDAIERSDILVRRIGDLRAKKEPQTVKVVTE